MSAKVADAKQIFLQAVESHEPERWPEFLQDACGTDTALRERVEALLAAYRKPNRILDSNRHQAKLELPPIAEQPGTVIGPYKLLEQIGEGGFGVVFLAEQERPVKRRVALKVIKPGMDTRQVIARFEAERQALALMDHPNIAKVHDAGATENGRPYFVMELVQGVPITEYCDQCNLTTRERLELFITVCHTVQHAHQKGIIHRDLKPTNVLVAMQDGKPAPKIIDFGVAKAVGQRLTEQTLTTAFAQMVGSPLYMSPEQAELSPLGVDTRSDIYSLGVLLYELLSGTTPFDKDRLHAASYDDMRRIIREEEPPRPSTRISTLAADLATTVAEHRRTDVRRLSQQVRGELDWIVMKCLEKDRNRRYETPNSLARDIERYLQDEPVQACPPSKVYRLKKFVRRNKVAAAFVALLLVGVVGLGISNIVIKWERDAKTTALAQARAVSDLVQEMIGSADAGRAKGVDYKVRELLDDFSAGLGSQLTDQPKVEADIHATIGRAYRSLRLPAQAQPHFEKAIELHQRMAPQQSEELAAILVDYGWNLNDQRRYDEAESQLHEALEIYHQRNVTGSPLFHALEILQHILISSHRDADAERVTEQALAIASAAGDEIPEKANLLHRYVAMKIRQGHFTDGERIARQAVALHRRLQGDQNPETAWALRTLARALVPQKKLDDAERAIRESLAIFRRQFPEDHPNIRETVGELKTILAAHDDKAALEALTKEQAEKAANSDSPGNRVRLAELLLTDDSINSSHNELKDVAHRLIRRAIEGYRRVAIESPNDFRSRMDAADGCAAAIQKCVATPGFGKEIDEMIQCLNAELPQLLATFGDSNQCQWEVAMCYSSLARVLFEHSDYQRTIEQALGETIEILTKYSLANPNRPYLWIWLGESYVGLSEVQQEAGRLVESEATFKIAMEIYGEHEAKIAADIIAEPFPRINSEIIAQHLGYAFLLATKHREKESAEFVRKAALITKRLIDPAELANALYFIALMQLRLGDKATYRVTCKALLDLPVKNVDDAIRWRALWTPCLAPDALDLDDMNLLTKRSEEFVAHNALGQPHFGLTSLGAALYRSGQYDRATQILEESIVAYPADPPRGFDMINSQRLFLAMTKWQLGQRDKARQLLAEALPAVDKELQSPSSAWNRRATLEVIRAEAKDLIGRKGANEAVEKKNRASDEPNK